MSLRQLPWMRDLQAGDVITNGGRWRLVRRVHRSGNGDLHCVHLAIRRCSWTRRCYTVLNATDLRCMGYRQVPGVRLKLRGDLDQQIEAAINQPAKEPYLLTCCDVEDAP